MLMLAPGIALILSPHLVLVLGLALVLALSCELAITSAVIGMLSNTDVQTGNSFSIGWTQNETC